jgi:hypothetical protein
MSVDRVGTVGPCPESPRRDDSKRFVRFRSSVMAHALSPVIVAAFAPAALALSPPGVAPLTSATLPAERLPAEPPRLAGDFTETDHPRPEPDALRPEPDASRRAPVVGPSTRALDQRSILEDLVHLVPAGPLAAPYESLFAPAPAPLVVRRYHGLERLFFERLSDVYKTAWQDQERLWIDRTSDPLSAILDRNDRFWAAKVDLASGGRWWERSVLESRTPETGGAPRDPELVDVGEEVEVLRLGDIALTNEFKLEAGGLDVFLGPRRLVGKEAAVSWSSRAGSDGRPGAGEPAESGASDATLDLERVLSGTCRAWRAGSGRVRVRPQGNVLATDCWAIDCRPNLTFAAPRGECSSLIQSAELDLDVTYHPQEVAACWRLLIVGASLSPGNRSAQLYVGTELLGW